MKNKKILFFVFIAICANVFLFLSIKKQNINNMAYCITTYSYLDKLKRIKDPIEKKSLFYVFQGLVNSKKDVLRDECLDIYKKAKEYISANDSLIKGDR